MLRPMLFIGVGGAGGKTLRVIRHELQKSLIKAGYKGAFPEAWQFLHFDITRDGVEFPSPMLDSESFHMVIPQGVNFKQIQGTIETGRSKEELQQLLAGWATPVPRVEFNGNLRLHRGIGRQVAIPNLKFTANVMQKSISKMKSPGAASELEEIGKLLGFTSSLSAPHAFLFSSLGGTTGSGMLIDIIEILRRSTTDFWANYLTTFLYTPEVFESLGGLSRDIPKNSFGAFNELIANRSNEVTLQSENLYSQVGLASNIPLGKKTLEHSVNFLIGTKNRQGVDIQLGTRRSGMDEVFLEIGESLVDVFIDPSTSEWFFNQQVNLSWPQLAPIDLSGLTSLHPMDGKPTCLASGIGFMKLSTGTDHFFDYLVDALTREQVEVLLWPKFDSGILNSESHFSEVVESAADQIWLEFLANSGAHENEAEQQITNRLLPDGWQVIISNNISELIDRQISKNPIEIEFFGKQLWDEWERESKKLLEEMKSNIDSNFEKWLIDFQVQLQSQTAESLSRHGFAITQNLISRLETELRDFALPVLIRESQEYASATGVFNYQTFIAQLHDWSNGLKHINGRKSELLYKIQSSLEKVIAFQLLSQVKEVGAIAIENLIVSILMPLEKLLSDKNFELIRMVKDAAWLSGTGNAFSDYPKWGSGSVPKKYGPRRTEVTLLETSDYESVFARYSIDSNGNEVPFQTLVKESLLGDPSKNLRQRANYQSLVTSETNWFLNALDISVRKVNNISKFDWKIPTNIDELRFRNARFIENTTGSLADFMKSSIQYFVSDPKISPEERLVREQKFLLKFIEQLGSSDPFITLNSNVVEKYVKQVNGLSPAGKVLHKYARIPFAPNSDLGKKCIEILKNHGYDALSASFESEWFDEGSKAQSIMAISTNNEALPLWAYSSMTEPLIKAARKNASEGISSWNDFSMGLRSRPLAEYIPLQREVRLSIITGWYIAQIFQLVVDLTDANSDTVKIWNCDEVTPEWNHFPNPLVISRNSGRLLPRVLISTGLALCDFGSTGNIQSIAGYLTLKRFGEEITSEVSRSDASSKSAILRDWVTNESLPANEFVISPKIQKILDQGKTRAESIDEFLSSVQADYKLGWTKSKEMAWQELPEIWEIKEDIDQVLTDIRTYVNGLSRATPSEDA